MRGRLGLGAVRARRMARARPSGGACAIRARLPRLPPRDHEPSAAMSIFMPPLGDVAHRQGTRPRCAMLGHARCPGTCAAASPQHVSRGPTFNESSAPAPAELGRPAAWQATHRGDGSCFSWVARGDGPADAFASRVLSVAFVDSPETPESWNWRPLERDAGQVFADRRP